MTLDEELIALARQGVRLWVDSGRLRIQAPHGVLTPNRREALAAHKDEIVALLRHTRVPGGASISAEQGVVSGPIPLTPRQHQFFRTEARRPGGNIPFFESRGVFDPSAARGAIAHLLVHHDGLRTRFTRVHESWQAFVVESEEHDVFSFLDVSQVPESDRAARVLDAVQGARACIDVERGPLLQAVLIRHDRGGESWVIFLVHHLVVDPLSMAILVEDFQTAHAQLLAGEVVRLPAKTSSYRAWAERLVDYAQTPEARDELGYWISAVPSRVAPLPVDHPDALGVKGRQRRIFVGMEPEETTALFRDAPRLYGVQSDRILVAALARAFSEWSGGPGLLLELAGHGREQLFADMDVSRTVGWFTTHFPVYLDAGSSSTPQEEVQAVNAALRRVPNAGIGYGVLRYLCAERAVVQALDRLPVAHATFNYPGRQEASLVTVPPVLLEGHLQQQAAGLPGRAHCRLKIVASAHGDRLFLRYGFHEGIYERASIDRLAGLTLTALRDMLP